MSTLGARLRKARAEKGWSQAELASATAVSQATISKIEREESESSTFTVKLALALDVRPEWLANGTGPMRPGAHSDEPGNARPVTPRSRVPVISWVSAGNWSEAFDPYAPGNAARWEELTERVNTLAFALQVRGDSMVGQPGQTSFPDGCLSDLFQEEVPLEFVRRAFATMTACPQHTFQILTKRADRLRALAPHLPWPSNIWMGVSVENQRAAHRARDLALTPAKVRFLSCEPLIGPLANLPLAGIHWMIVGGESGPKARPMKAEWVEDLYRQARAAGVAFFFKQWGGVRKDLTGRTFRGRTYDEMPRTAKTRSETRERVAAAGD